MGGGEGKKRVSFADLMIKVMFYSILTRPINCSCKECVFS